MISVNNYQEPEKLKSEEAAAEDLTEKTAAEEAQAAREAKEAKKMKIRKVLYPIAIIAIILLWLSSFLEGR